MEAYESWLGARLRGLGFAKPNDGPTGDDVEDVVARATGGDVARCEADGVAAFVDEVRLCAAGGVGTVAVVRGTGLGGVDAMALAVRASAVVGNAVWLGGAVANRKEKVWGQSFPPGLEVESAVFVVARPAETVACDTTAGCVQVGGTCAFMAAFNVAIKNKTVLKRLGVAFPPEVAAYMDALAACAVEDSAVLLRNIGQRCPKPPEALKAAWGTESKFLNDYDGYKHSRFEHHFSRVESALLRISSRGFASKVLHRALAEVAETFYARPGAYELWPPGPPSVFESAVKERNAKIRVGGLTLDANVILDGIGVNAPPTNRAAAANELTKALDRLFAEKEFGVGYLKLLHNAVNPICALMSTSNAIVKNTPAAPVTTRPNERPQVWVYSAEMPNTITNSAFRQALRELAAPNNGTVVIGGVVLIPGHAVAWAVCPNGDAQIWDSNYRRFARDEGTGIDELAEDYNVVEKYGTKIVDVVVVAITPAAAFVDAVVQPYDEYTGVPQPLESQSAETVAAEARLLHIESRRVYYSAKHWFANHTVAPIIPEDSLAIHMGIDSFRDFVALKARASINRAGYPAISVLAPLTDLFRNNAELEAAVDRRVESNNVGLRVIKGKSTAVEIDVGSRTWVITCSKDVGGKGALETAWNMMSASPTITEKGLRDDSEHHHAARAFAYIFVNYGNPFRESVRLTKAERDDVIAAYEALGASQYARAFLKARPERS
jgi:hypothetical protein